MGSFEVRTDHQVAELTSVPPVCLCFLSAHGIETEAYGGEIAGAPKLQLRKHRCRQFLSVASKSFSQKREHRICGTLVVVAKIVLGVVKRHDLVRYT